MDFVFRLPFRSPQSASLVFLTNLPVSRKAFVVTLEILARDGATLDAAGLRGLDWSNHFDSFFQYVPSNEDASIYRGDSFELPPHADAVIATVHRWNASAPAADRVFGEVLLHQTIPEPGDLPHASITIKGSR